MLENTTLSYRVWAGMTTRIAEESRNTMRYYAEHINIVSSSKPVENRLAIFDREKAIMTVFKAEKAILSVSA